MKNKVIRLVCAMENSAEKEYIKEFFNFIGCFFFDKKINLRNQDDWFRFLKIGNGKYDVEIFVNYFGDDPYLQESKLRGTKRIYCYFSFEEGYVKVVEKPLSSLKELQVNKNTNKKALRQTALNELIGLIWKNEPNIEKAILNIVALYTDNPYGDLFHFLQLKHSFDILSLKDGAKLFNDNIPTIRLRPYLMNSFNSISFVFEALNSHNDPYSQYVKINAACMIHDLYQVIDPTARLSIQKHCYKKTLDDIIAMLTDLLNDHSNFSSAYLLFAPVNYYVTNHVQNSENCYVKLLSSIPKGQKEYVFIWYKYGLFLEKIDDIKMALDCYRKTIEFDSNYYPALLNLGYFDAVDGRFKESESKLNKALDAIFCSKSPNLYMNGRMESWEHLSLKEILYLIRIYHLLAKIAINTNREYSARGYAEMLCIATDFFEKARLVQQISNLDEYNNFISYYSLSEPVWAAWHILKPWGEGIVNSQYVTNTVHERILKYPQNFYGK